MYKSISPHSRFSPLCSREILLNSKLNITNPIILHLIMRTHDPIVSSSSIFYTNFLRALSPLNGSPLKQVIINSRKINYRCEALLRILKWKLNKSRKKGIFSKFKRNNRVLCYRYFDVFNSGHKKPQSWLETLTPTKYIARQTRITDAYRIEK